MKRLPLRYLFGVLALLVMLGHSADRYTIPIVRQLEDFLYDAKVRLTMPRTVDDRIVILDIDEKSLGAEGRWPWSRDKLATLMDKLFDSYGVSMVGFDVVFAEPDVSSGIKTLEGLARKEFKSNQGFQDSLKRLRPSLDFDGRFARSMSGRPVILGYYFSEDGKAVNSGALPPPLWPKFLFGERPIYFQKKTGFGANLSIFQNAAAGAGHYNPMIEGDGIVRRVPLVVEFEDNLYETLALAMLRQHVGAKDVVEGVASAWDGAGVEGYGGLEWFDVKGDHGELYRIPVDSDVAALVPFRGEQNSFVYISMSDALHGLTPKDQLAGKIVLVGTSAPGLQDLRATPVSPSYAGVELHANLLAGMLDGTIKYKPQYVLAIDVILVLASGLILIFFLPRLPPLQATALGILILSLQLCINFGFWFAENWVVPLAPVLTTVTAIYFFNMAWGFFVESRTKRQFAQLFGQYVPPELVDEMARNPEGYSMEGRKADLTVLFSDVRGFTTISEGLAPDQLAALMNEYLGAMTKIIRGNRGTLDKYIGDAIMAFWGAPVADGDHALRATLTALDMQVGMAELNKELLAKGWPELKIGVGVNSGSMTVGDMGSPVRKAYTVMGDAVNLGSRLEGITKQYGVGIIIGEETHQIVKGQVRCRELDRVRVKGKAEPVGIYEPLGRVGDIAEEVLADLELWEQALRFYRSQEWDSAQELLEKLAARRQHYLYGLYTKRIEHLRSEPPGAQWDGVTTFETK